MKTNGETELPMISVLMGVLNCESTLDESIRSVLSQTESRWELIVCDDGSTDGTADVIRAWAEKYPGQIVFLQNDRNYGLSHTLNRCLEQARGEYIARMDGDDRCAAERFAKELASLEANPEIAIVSTDMECFDENGTWGLRQYPTDPQPAELVHGTPFCHAACMVRTAAIRDAGGYSEAEDRARVEDYDLWVRMYAKGYRGHNIHEPLYSMRDDRDAAGRRLWKYRVNEARVRLSAVRLLGLPKSKAVYALRPLILGLLPMGVYRFLHNRKLRKESA